LAAVFAESAVASNELKREFAAQNQAERVLDREATQSIAAQNHAERVLDCESNKSIQQADVTARLQVAKLDNRTKLAIEMMARGVPAEQIKMRLDEILAIED
jgi:hypothetical protein